MTARFGLTLASELHGPEDLVDLAVSAEDHGFDFVSISDHYHPWIREQGHSPFVWTVLGAIAARTERIEVGVGVTCPTVRIHPAILAQATATTASLLPGRFVWGVGTGEALNEQILGDPWPPAEERLAMLVEAIEIVRELWGGESTTYRGSFYLVEDATIFDPPPEKVPIVVAAFGESAAGVAADIGDGLWTTGTGEGVIERYRDGGGDGPVYSQITLCWSPDREEAVKTAHRLWPNTALPGQLAQDLRTPLHFEQAVELVTPKMIAESMACGPDLAPIVETAEQALEAGVDNLYFNQIGDVEGFLGFWDEELQPALAELTG